MIEFQYIGAALGMVGMGMLSLAPSRVLMALGITAISCVFMGLYGFLTGQYGIVVAQLTYLIFNIIGIFSWRKVNVKLRSNKKDDDSRRHSY